MAQGVAEAVKEASLTCHVGGYIITLFNWGYRGDSTYIYICMYV